jgi:hypothetical protein
LSPNSSQGHERKRIRAGIIKTLHQVRRSPYKHRDEGPLITHLRKSSDGSGDLRNKIVDLLSTTANGCLSELGYFPGMQDQFQQLIQTNMHLQNDNAKLFEDNRALARVVAIQNDRLAFSAGEDNIKLKQFSEMKESIEFLSKEQTRLTRANEMLKITSLDQGNGRLYSEWQVLQAKNDSLERDNARVRDDFTRLYNLAAANGILGKVPPVQHTQRNGERPLHSYILNSDGIHRYVESIIEQRPTTSF